MNKILLWLDDYRDPFENPEWVKMFCPRAYFEHWDIIWVKNYDEFIDYFITENSLPTYICFDHDLADESDNEKTGYDCAYWLVEYYMDLDLPLPLYNSQSSNPVGKENILSLLNQYNKEYNSTH